MARTIADGALSAPTPSTSSLRTPVRDHRPVASSNMAFLESLKAQFRPSDNQEGPPVPVLSRDKESAPSDDGSSVKHETVPVAAAGVAKVEAVQVVYGKYGKYFLWAGLAMMMIVLYVIPLDHRTVSLAGR